MERIPLDELEVKLGLLQHITNLDNKTSTEICNELKANFNIICDEYDIHLLMNPKVINDIDEAIITYKDLI